MKYNYIDATGGTGLVKTTLPFIAVFALSLMPNSNHYIPQQIITNYGEYAENNTQPVTNSNSQMSQNEQAEILLSSANKLAGNTKDLDNDISQIISNDFWEMSDVRDVEKMSAETHADLVSRVLREAGLTRQMNFSNAKRLSVKERKRLGEVFSNEKTLGEYVDEDRRARG